MNRLTKPFLLMFPALLIYAYFCNDLNITQDDAYISYRYVVNYLSGHGLVYNLGERVEGFTNFGWVVYLLFCGVLGLGQIAISKVTGCLFGAGLIILTFLISGHVFSRRDAAFRWLAVYLVSVNQSLAYWSPAGLETAAFAFFAFASLFLYLKRSWLLIWTLTIAVLLRPEGALVAFIILVTESVETARLPRLGVRCVLVAIIFILPLLIFKLTYYGSILPNPFYAKTGLSFDRLADGVEYVGRFLSHYGFYGVGLLIPIALRKKLSRGMTSILIFSLVWTLYIVVIGGDVLKVHRFFIPLLGTNALLISTSVWLVLRTLGSRWRKIALSLVAVSLLLGTFILPRDFVLTYNRLEERLVSNMSFVAERLVASDKSDFSVAASTIGVFGYRLTGHHVIDMLGLTDSTIAKHPATMESSIPSTWKERKHNATYVLSLQPDYILFSTGLKPSAPAEKSLLLYKPFLDSYRTIGWLPDKGGGRSGVCQVFKRFRPLVGELKPSYPIEFVELFKRGIEAYVAGNQRQAVSCYDSAIAVSPRPAYIYISCQKALSLALMKQVERAVALMDSVVATDSLLFLTHAKLYTYSLAVGDSIKASVHRRWLHELTPEYLSQLDAQVADVLRRIDSDRR